MERSQQRKLLSAFLRSRRQRISPSDCGLPEHGRRRTTGLRREDVALLSAVSLSWYTWLEQGREVRPSADALERISETLRLTDNEKDYLFSLAHNRPPPLSDGVPIYEVSPRVKRMIDKLQFPAVIHTSRWDIVAWNKIAVSVFRDYSSLPAKERNVLWLILTGPDPEELSDEYYRLVGNMVSHLRIDYSHAGGDPSFDELIARLTKASPLFRQLWERPEVSGEMEGLSLVEHPDVGRITFEHTCYCVEGTSLRMFVFVPYDEPSTERLERLRQDIQRRKTSELHI